MAFSREFAGSTEKALRSPYRYLDRPVSALLRHYTPVRHSAAHLLETSSSARRVFGRSTPRELVL
jgi:hypothetical protein